MFWRRWTDWSLDEIERVLNRQRGRRGLPRIEIMLVMTAREEVVMVDRKHGMSIGADLGHRLTPFTPPGFGIFTGPPGALNPAGTMQGIIKARLLRVVGDDEPPHR